MSIANRLRRGPSVLALFITLGLALSAEALTVAPVEDVMTSPFFSGTDLVRGFAGDGRVTHRVSNTDPFGLPGEETIYLSFDGIDLSSFTGPITATLTVQSTSGNFGADAGPTNPFLVSAHGVDADPIASITDDTNPSGPIDFRTFASSNVLTADPAAFTTVDAFGPIDFDVTALVSSWISGVNTNQFIALSGRNQAPGTDFLHGFLNESETPGSTFLTIVPEPGTALLLLLGLGGLAASGERSERRA
ncbi:MAG: PEP-CTERM sorting domain-containing protein [Myxococcota bacterium]